MYVCTYLHTSCIVYDTHTHTHTHTRTHIYNTNTQTNTHTHTNQIKGMPNNIFAKSLPEEEIFEKVGKGKAVGQLYGLGAPW